MIHPNPRRYDDGVRRGAGRRALLSWTVWTFVVSAGSVAAEKPERTLIDFLTKPFAPLESTSHDCARDSAIYLSELDRYTPWALQMYDASVKIPPGVITGNYQQLGNYDECLEVRSGHGFTGMACTASMNFEIAKNGSKPCQPDMGDILKNMAIAAGYTKWSSGRTINYEWMWCVPSTCNRTDVQDALEIGLDSLKVEDRVDLAVNISCRTAEMDRAVYDVSDWIYIWILAMFVVIIIASTSYDIVKQGHPGTLNRKDRRHMLLTAFSVYTNGKNLLTTDRHKDSIKCIDGLRYISIGWIIYGHTHYMEAVGVNMNMNEILKMHTNWANMLVLNANIITDTFFLISGVLLSYTVALKKEKDLNSCFKIFAVYLHRYIRLTPAYAMMVGFYATLLYKTGSGPRWDQWVGANKILCRKYWWANLLYVNNEVAPMNACMSQSWYLSVDMQLTLSAPILLYPMLKCTRPIIFWLFFSLALIVSILVPFLITFCQKLSGTMLYYKNTADTVNVFIQIYTKAYSRYGAYIIGLLVGYILYKTRSKTIKISRVYVTVGWIIAIVSGFLVFTGPRWMYFEDHVYDRVEASFYAGLHRHVFALSISWIILCCAHGYGGIVNIFLSWNGWVPLSKLTYSAYLCHFVFLLIRAGSTRTTDFISVMGLLRSFTSNLCLTMLLAAIWALCFEMPFLTLDRVLLYDQKKAGKHLTKPHQVKAFPSTESSQVIYRSSEETATTKSHACKHALNRRSSEGSLYDSAEYQQGLFHSNSTQDLKSHDREDKCPFIFVIGPEKTDCWGNVRNVHQNNGFHDDVDGSFKRSAEKRSLRDYESIVNEDSMRKNGRRGSGQGAES